MTRGNTIFKLYIQFKTLPLIYDVSNHVIDYYYLGYHKQKYMWNKLINKPLNLQNINKL